MSEAKSIDAAYPFFGTKVTSSNFNGIGTVEGLVWQSHNNTAQARIGISGKNGASFMWVPAKDCFIYTEPEKFKPTCVDRRFDDVAKALCAMHGPAWAAHMTKRVDVWTEKPDYNFPGEWVRLDFHRWPVEDAIMYSRPLFKKHFDETLTRILSTEKSSSDSTQQ